MQCKFLGILLTLAPAVLSQESPPTTPKPETAPQVAKATIDKVRAELESMLDSDQSYRSEISELERKHGKDSNEVREAWSKQLLIDAHNLRRLEEIILQHGWPGWTQFGNKAASASFLILQHSDLAVQKKYLPLAQAAAAKGEMHPFNLYTLEDRIRLREGQKQIYGSQVTKNSNDEWEPLPVEDESELEALRASVGLPSMAEYLQGFSERSGGRVSQKWSKKSEPNKAPEPAPGSVTPPATEAKSK